MRFLPVLAALACSVAAAAPPADPFPKAAASYVVAVDGSVRWAHEAAAPRAPASLTKIMTALVLLEGPWKPDAPVVVSRRAAAETGARLGLRAGETLTASDLLTALLVRSANDACVALAEHAAGSENAFVASMNERARSLGLAATHFENACGHDAPGQRSSAEDLLRLTELALRHETFARLVALPSAEVRTSAGRTFRIRSSNALLGSLEGARGVKTGFTQKAGKCVVALAVRDRTRVLVVLLDSDDRWWTAAALFEKAFDAARSAD